MAAVSRRDLYYVSENKSFCFGPNFWISRSPDFPNLAWAGSGLDLGGGGEMLASHALLLMALDIKDQGSRSDDQEPRTKCQLEVSEMRKVGLIRFCQNGSALFVEAHNFWK